MAIGFRPLPLAAGGIAFDAASNSGYQTAAATYTWNHTCTGSNRWLAVGISMLSVAGSSVSSITYNGVALSLIDARASVSGAVRAELWGLANPASGTNTISVTLSAALDSIGNATSLVNVNQSLPTEAANDASATNVGAADATVDVTTVTDQDWVIDCVASSDTSITVSAGQTQRGNVTGTLGSGAMSTEGPKTPAGAVTMSWTNVGAAQTWTTVAVGVRINTAAGAAVPQGWFVQPAEVPRKAPPIDYPVLLSQQPVTQLTGVPWLAPPDVAPRKAFPVDAPVQFAQRSVTQLIGVPWQTPIDYAARKVAPLDSPTVVPSIAVTTGRTLGWFAPPDVVPPRRAPPQDIPSFTSNVGSLKAVWGWQPQSADQAPRRPSPIDWPSEIPRPFTQLIGVPWQTSALTSRAKAAPLDSPAPVPSPVVTGGTSIGWLTVPEALKSTSAPSSQPPAFVSISAFIPAPQGWLTPIVDRVAPRPAPIDYPVSLILLPPVIEEPQGGGGKRRNFPSYIPQAPWDAKKRPPLQPIWDRRRRAEQEEKALQERERAAGRFPAPMPPVGIFHTPQPVSYPQPTQFASRQVARIAQQSRDAQDIADMQDIVSMQGQDASDMQDVSDIMTLIEGIE